MPADPVRATALDILDRLEAEGHTLEFYLQTLAPSDQFSQQRDRNLIFALVYGVSRWRAQLDWIIAQFSRIPASKIDTAVTNILRMALFQVFHLERVPPSAAVNTAVALTRQRVGARATGFVNAVLRNVLRRRGQIRYPDPKSEPTLALSVGHAHPQWMIQRWVDRYGFHVTESICRANNRMAPLTLRANTLTVNRAQLIDHLRRAGFTAEATLFSPWGVLVGGRDARVLQSEAFAQGWFQVQDEAAQLVSLILDARPGQKVLDACAGRGGKTANLAQTMKNIGRIVATDRVAAKLDALEHEMARLGITIAKPLVRDFGKASYMPDEGQFDRILVDAPCTGMGVLRRHPEAKWRLRPGDIRRHAGRQERLLAETAPMLKQAGVLVYAVCSTEPEETNALIERFLEQHPHFTLESVLPHLPSNAREMSDKKGCLRTCVHRHGVDGFFAVRLRRRSDRQA
jgi:16S rRNA (cytosine967-C5)-methyltransferase